MKKLCCIFNIPSLYREAIYKEIDMHYDCEWYFEKENIDIALFDITQLRNATLLEHKSLCGRFYRMKGLLRAIWKKKDFDAYIMIGTPMCISLWGVCILLNLFRPKKKIYFWTHGWYGKESWIESIIKNLFLKLADELFLYGNHSKRLLHDKGYSEDIMHVIHNSLSYDVQLMLRNNAHSNDIYKSHFGNEYPILIFIGRLTAVKKLDILIDTLSLLKLKGRLYNLVLVGDGAEKENLIRMVNDLNLNSQVWFYGACYDENTNAELIYNADLCVSPGNIGLTAMHVMMFGCPAITHNDFAYQMPEFESIKPYETGNFFVKDSSSSLMEIIEHWFTINGSRREDIRKACFDEIDHYWNPTYQMNIIKQVIG